MIFGHRFSALHSTSPFEEVPRKYLQSSLPCAWYVPRSQEVDTQSCPPLFHIYSASQCPRHEQSFAQA